MVYSYDVFISYRREEYQNAWIIEYFIPRLRAHLANEVVAQCGAHLGTIFFDQTDVDAAIRTGLPGAVGIEPGAKWQGALKNAISVSKCMIGLWSPTYFSSHWCNVEWQSFQAREAKAEVPIIIPVSVYNINRLPQQALEYHVIKMDDYVIDGPSLRESRIFYDFNQTLKLVAEKVARAVCKPPPFEVWAVDDNPPKPTTAPAPTVARF